MSSGHKFAQLTALYDGLWMASRECTGWNGSGTMGLEGIMVSARKHNTIPTIVPVPAEPATVRVRSFRV